MCPGTCTLKNTHTYTNAQAHMLTHIHTHIQKILKEGILKTRRNGWRPSKGAVSSPLGFLGELGILVSQEAAHLIGQQRKLRLKIIQEIS